MLILGLNAYHGDSAACVFLDGQLIAAAEEERFRRVKHWAGLPTQAIDHCLKEAGASLEKVDHIAVNRKPGANNWRRLGFVLTRWPDPRLMWQKIRNMRSAAGVKEALEHSYGVSLGGQLHYVEHHLAHLASAFHLSRFDEAACISIDGFGDFASTAIGFGRGQRIGIDQRVYFPHSLGIFYSAITQFIGFPHYGDEYKVMGLAPYGEPRFLPQMRELVRVQPDGTFRLVLNFFRHHTDNVSYSWNDCAPEVGTLFTNDLANLMGPARQPGEPIKQKHKDLARSAQAMYEEAFFALLESAHARYHCDNLALAGGCAMNSVANGKVYLKTPFKRMYLPAAAGDAGGAIGAAAVVALQVGANSSQEETRKLITSPPPVSHEAEKVDLETPPTDSDLSSTSAFCLPPSALSAISSPFLGPWFSEDRIWQLLSARKEETRSAACHVSQMNTTRLLCIRTAQAIAEGKVVGWFQGRMEWGPRALGNRSILSDPRRADMKEILNAKIKRRESFRPFAPSILREAVNEWFEQDDDVPYMMEVFQIKEEKRPLLPAVCHIDGSGRLQTVHREINPLYHQLISAFCSLTSVPLVLNTSFNENEPIVCRPEEALACFLRTKMDVLVMGSFFLERKGAEAQRKLQPAGGNETARMNDKDKDAIPAEAYAIGQRLRAGMGAEEVYLFGSHARGNATVDSDLDFLAIVPQSSESSYRRAVEALGHTRDVRFPKDIIVMTRAEWERDLEVVCSLASTVRREGKLLRE